MTEHNWSDDSALYQWRYGDDSTTRTMSAESYLRDRLAGSNRDEAAEHELIRQQQEDTDQHASVDAIEAAMRAGEAVTGR